MAISILDGRDNIRGMWAAMGPWSFKEKRRFLEVAASSKSFEEIVARAGRSPEAVRRMAIQIGITLKEPPRSARTNKVAAWVKDEAEKKSLLHPTSSLRDDTPLEQIQLSTRLRNALESGGLKTVGEVRVASDAKLLSFQNLGKGSIRHLRQTLG
jgi:DNA-directed RNA polymerase alpha subunit